MEGMSCPGAGWVEIRGDCDDTNALFFPGATEYCDGADNDCDGEQDEGGVDPAMGWVDVDRDGFGASGREILTCVPTILIAPRPGDCDETNATVNPGATEDCSRSGDEDCDGLADCEDADCFGVIACQEDCLTPGDEDSDGLEDCEDDDCWTVPGCASTTARLVQRTMDGRRFETHSGFFVCERDTAFVVSHAGWGGLCRGGRGHRQRADGHGGNRCVQLVRRGGGLPPA